MAGGAEVVIRATCSRRLAARFGYVVAMKDQRIGCGRGWSELARRDAAGEKSPDLMSLEAAGSVIDHRSSQYLPPFSS
jgi:hypothetical protein